MQPEAVEESIAYLANNVAGKAILGDLADDFDLKQLGYSALLGGISGGVMGGGASAIGAVQNSDPLSKFRNTEKPLAKFREQQNKPLQLIPKS